MYAKNHHACLAIKTRQLWVHAKPLDLAAWNFYFQNCSSPFLAWANIWPDLTRPDPKVRLVMYKLRNTYMVLVFWLCIFIHHKIVLYLYIRCLYRYSTLGRHGFFVCADFLKIRSRATNRKTFDFRCCCNLCSASYFLIPWSRAASFDCFGDVCGSVTRL